MNVEASFLDSLIQAVQCSRKYRDLQIPRATLEDILAYEIQHSATRKELEANFRKSLHNVIAPYLESIDYPDEAAAVLELRAQKPSTETLKAWCVSRMRLHASSRERLLFLESFYQTIFAKTGTPKTILDLACALDPLTAAILTLDQIRSMFEELWDVEKDLLAYFDKSHSGVMPETCAD